jgi:hypothetical protein
MTVDIVSTNGARDGTPCLRFLVVVQWTISVIGANLERHDSSSKGIDPMKLLQCALLAATIAAAEKLPVLTEPRVFQATLGASITAWKDSAVVVRWGRIDFFTRRNTGILRGDSLISTAINSDWPRFFNMFDTAHFVLGNDFVKQSGSNFGGGSLGFKLGDTYPQGGVVRENSGWRVLGCSFNMAVEINGANGWGLADSISMGVSYPNLLCDADQSTGQGVMMWRMLDNRRRITSGNVKGILRAVPTDTLALDGNFMWLVAGWDGLWLTYDSKSRMLVSKSRNPLRIDSVMMPFLGGTQFSPQVARKDSLVVFGMDSSLVLVKWTPTGKPKFVKQIDLGAGIHAVTASDSLVWVSTAKGLYSFQLDWQEATTTSLASRGHELSGLAVTSTGRETSFTWNGMGNVALEVISLDGRNAASFTMSAGQTSRWQATRPGVYLARSSQGTKAFVVR